MLNKSFTTLFLILLAGILNSQNDSISKYQLGVKGGYGYIITHSPSMEYITEQHISKFEIYAEKNTLGDKDWHQHIGFPRIGLSFSYFNFNNDEHIGKGYSFAPHLNFKLIGNKRIQFNLKPAIGIGYIQKPFDVEKNFKNSAIGSNLNIFFSVLFETEIQLSKNMGLLMAVNFSHFSNTAFKSPNLGINIPTVEAGIYRRIGPNSVRKPMDKSPFQKAKSFWTVTLGSGFNEISPPTGKKYIATAFSVANEKRISHKSSIAASLDLFYNPAIIDRLEVSSIYIEKGYENLQIGASFNHILHLGRLQNTIQFGYYLKSKDKELGKLYQIVGGRYKINSRWDALLLFKTHFAKAEYIMAGIGVKLEKDEK